MDASNPPAIDVPTAWSSSTRASPRWTASPSACPRLDHRPARRQRRRQDHHHRHDHGPGRAHRRQRRACSARRCRGALPRAAPDEFREPLCRHADAADGAAELSRSIAQLYGVGDLDARIDGLAHDLQTSPNSSPRERQAVGSGRSTRVALAKSLLNEPASCCSTSRPPRSIRTPPTGCARYWKPTARDNHATSCSPRTT